MVTQTAVKVGVIIQLNPGSHAVVRLEPNAKMLTGRTHQTTHSSLFFLAKVDIGPSAADGTITIYVPYAAKLHDDLMRID